HADESAHAWELPIDHDIHGVEAVEGNPARDAGRREVRDWPDLEVRAVDEPRDAVCARSEGRVLPDEYLADLHIGEWVVGRGHGDARIPRRDHQTGWGGEGVLGHAAAGPGDPDRPRVEDSDGGVLGEAEAAVV